MISAVVWTNDVLEVLLSDIADPLELENQVCFALAVASRTVIAVYRPLLEPMGLTQAALAEAMGVQRKHVNELCNARRSVTAATALILARVFGNSPDFWLNVQRRSDLWEAMHSPRERERIKRARRLTAA